MKLIYRDSLRFAILFFNAPMKKELQDAREDYQKHFLEKDKVKKDAIGQFKDWLGDYRAVATVDFNAMTLSTVSQEGFPSSRVVLLKGLGHDSFEFFTNYTSQKGQEMEANPQVALCFYWPALERQVRVQGVVEKLSPQESDEYFATRPHGSRVGAWASPQSEVVDGRAEVEDAWKSFEEKFGEEVPRPPHWGGYRVIPSRVEFWQGRRSRLHDRILYTRAQQGWTIERLAP